MINSSQFFFKYIFYFIFSCFFKFMKVKKWNCLIINFYFNVISYIILVFKFFWFIYIFELFFINCNCIFIWIYYLYMLIYIFIFLYFNFSGYFGLGFGLILFFISITSFLNSSSNFLLVSFSNFLGSTKPDEANFFLSSLLINLFSFEIL